ncbi:hypothetical protein SARC_08099 [Sphaeroforma arctica JP610]|uniref:Uncharacterized protein n=1 Tax=Sphaeroforma arctica JP610 TaxID=667725 RepID=A0A0L0FRX3_9EUKA|nr:hypothetical protein SARC_08099 [Sphaeroforma arctica JP610]KNC79505.1 hypothetical protein SARC_08099 [Sphaeroforma arctica JP610]|eukprot:XP_014153407.1 hypothetical protein SARC_08099 [Sphaeroforma arctica JP610]
MHIATTTLILKQYDESRDQGRKCSVTIPLFEGVQDSNPWETYQPNQAAHTRTLLVDSTHKYNHMTPLRSSFPWTDAPPPPVSVFRRLCKRYSLQIGLAEVVSLRVKEGYVITNITKASETSPKTTQNASDSGIDTDTKSKTEPHPPITVVCSLAWKQFCNIEYHITGQRPLHTHSSSQIDTPTATAPSTDGIYSQTSFSSHAGSETPNTGAHVPTSTSTPTSRSTGTHTSTRTGIGTDAHTSPDASEHSRESTHEDSVGNTQARVSNDGPVEGLGSEAQATEDKTVDHPNSNTHASENTCHGCECTVSYVTYRHATAAASEDASFEYAIVPIPLTAFYLTTRSTAEVEIVFSANKDNSDSSAYLLTEDIGASHTPVTGARGTNTTTAQSEIEINQGLGHIEAGFLEYWRAVVAIGTASWERWLDCDRLAMTLIPDHTPNVDRSYVHKLNLKLTYKTATAVVTTVATEWASMVLIEGHTYVRFIDIEAMTRDATCQREKDEDIALVRTCGCMRGL